jgi:hypothetical protein
MATIGMLAVVGYFAIGAARQYLIARIILREATATVKAKEYVRFDETNHTYLDDDGRRIEKSPGEQQWRVYYQIDDFNNLDEATRGRLLRSEEERSAAGRLRFRDKSKEWYEKLETGDKLRVLYQWRGDDSIDVAYVENPKSPNLQ